MAEKEEEPKKEMTFLQHLEEFRWVLVRSAIAIAVTTLASLIGYKFIFDGIILAPKSPDFITYRLLCKLGELINVPSLCLEVKPINLINIDLAGQFNTHLHISVIIGLVLAIPYIIYQIWLFISPALYTEEQKKTKYVVVAISSLFVFGVLFGYYLIVPFSVQFLGSYSLSDQIVNQINLKSYISTVSSLSLATGLVFELPVLIFFLTKIGIITPEFLKKYRKHVFVVLMIIAGIITPPDVISLILVTIPLWLLFEVSIVVSTKVVNKKRQKAEPKP